MTICIAALAAGFAAFVVWSVIPVAQGAPVQASTKILARDGSLLYEAGSPRGLSTPVQLDAVSPAFLKMVVASEDTRFYRHHGIDWRSLVRVARDVVLYGRATGGASTIEQQVVKNLFFPGRPRTVVQKLREMAAAAYWARTHTKNETLAAYVNTVYFGNQAYGIQAAAERYFHSSAKDLSIAESAMLVGVIPAPSAADPYAHRSEANKRERKVLDRMAEIGVISADERETARASDVVVFAPRHEIAAPHFVLRVLGELEERIPDIRTGGYIVRTTLDPALQTVAEASVSRRLAKLGEQNVNDAAVVAMDPSTGEVLAYVGSASYFDDAIQGQVDMAAAKRQPGSALKPFLSFAAFLQGKTPATVVADLPVRFDTADGKAYYPRNYNHKVNGPVSLREALGSSLNIPAAKLLDDVGLESFFRILARFGLDFPEQPDHYGLGVVLGGGEVSLADATRAYAELARSARAVPFTTVLEIRDARGRVVEQASAAKQAPLFDDEGKAAQAAYLVTDILTDPKARARGFGETSLMEIGRRVAAKTGTTKDFRDNWAFGATPDFALGVWVGNADNTPMQGVSGITGAVPIWHDIMADRFERRDAASWPAPPGIVEREVCVTSGLLANGVCPKTRVEKFMAGTEPTRPDTWYVALDVDAESGFLATPACQRNVVRKTYLRPPSEYDAWLAATGYESPPSRDCEGHELAQSSSPLTILSPLDGETFERDDALVGAEQRIPFVAGGERRPAYRWILNGHDLAATDPSFLWDPAPGDYTLGLDGADRQVRFTVQ